jgi:aspartokinase/homoserine dehydrogenase 1
MTPCIEADIPIYVRNIFNPSHPGTVITGRACSLETSSIGWAGELKSARRELRKAACPVALGDNASPIRGVTSVDSVAILNVQVGDALLA